MGRTNCLGDTGVMGNDAHGRRLQIAAFLLTAAAPNRRRIQPANGQREPLRWKGKRGDRGGIAPKTLFMFSDFDRSTCRGGGGLRHFVSVCGGSGARCSAVLCCVAKGQCCCGLSASKNTSGFPPQNTSQLTAVDCTNTAVCSLSLSRSSRHPALAKECLLEAQS